MALPLAGLLLAGVSLVAEAKIYRWVDANGVVQYSDRPPAEQSAETITVRGAKAVDQSPDQPPSTDAPDNQPAKQEPEPAPAISPEQQAAIDEARAENCRRARSNLTFLQNNPPNRLLDTDEDGNVYRLTVEDHTARMQKANDAIGEYCEN